MVPSASASRQRLHVALAAQRRRHLHVRVVVAHRLVGQHEVVRRHLGGDADAARAGVAHQPHGARGRDVGDVQMRRPSARRAGCRGPPSRPRRRTGWPGRPSSVETRPSFITPVVGEVAILRVADDRHAEGQRVLHARGGTASAFITHLPSSEKATQPASACSPISASSSPLRPARDRADRIDAHAALHARLGEDVVGDGAVVVDREGVGHARHRGEAARRRRAGARCDRLLVLEARLAQVHVDVDEARAARPCPRRRPSAAPSGALSAGADLGDLAVGDEHVLDGVHPVPGSITRPPLIRRFMRPCSRRGGRAPPCAPPRRW